MSAGQRRQAVKLAARAPAPTLIPAEKFSMAHGNGYNATTGRYDLPLHPAAKVVLVDGTTAAQVGQIQHCANAAAGRAATRHDMGDWLLFPDGGTTVGTLWSSVDSQSSEPRAGRDAQYPFVIGTFDPADPTNPAKWLKGGHTFDSSGSPDYSVFWYGRTRNIANVAFVGLHFKVALSDCDKYVAVYNTDTYKVTSGVLFDGCVFDGIMTGVLHSVTLPSDGSPVLAWSSNLFLNNLTYHRCGNLYATSDAGGRSGNSGEALVSGLRYQYCIQHHGGWSADHTRNTPSYYGSKSTQCDGVTRTYPFPTMLAHSRTSDVAIDPFIVRIEQNTEPWGNRDLVKGTEYTIAYTRTAPTTTGCTVTLLPGFAVPDSSWALTVRPRSSGPDQYKHNWYVSQDVRNVALIGNIGSWDSSNAKFTGGPYTVLDHVEIRSPMGFIHEASGNDGTGTFWPQGAEFFCDGYLQIEGCDINTLEGANRGFGPWMFSTKPGSCFKNGVAINQGGTQPQGLRIAAQGVDGVGNPKRAYCSVTNSIWANWRFMPDEVAINRPTLNYRTFDDCVWDESTFSSNINRAQMPDIALQTAINTVLARNIHTTFRIEQSIPVIVDADPLVTEDRVMAYIARNPTQRQWNALIRTHFLSPLGRT